MPHRNHIQQLLLDFAALSERPLRQQPRFGCGPARLTLGNVIFFFAVVTVIVGLASLVILSERIVSNAPAQPDISTVGQSRPPATK
jgi:hypothetical protein